MNSEDGVASVEYALLLTLIILVCVSTLNAIGSRTYNIYTIIDSNMP